MRIKRRSLIAICSGALWLTACAAPIPSPLAPAEATAIDQAAPSHIPTAASSWITLVPGLERREVSVPFVSLGFEERLVLFRIDPAVLTFRVLYAPGFPQRVSQWGAGSQAQLTFNAGFFDERDAALGLLVSDGRHFGESYVDFGGMLAVDGDGRAALRSLAEQPYEPGEALAQAVQGFPMLVYPDGSAFAGGDSARARRTALGQDSSGRIVVALSPREAFSLAELGAWLRGSDLDLRLALNLDGGGSTGYYAGPNDMVDSFTPVPAVIAVSSPPENR